MLDPVKKDNMKRYQVFLHPKAVEQIKAIANGRSVAEVIRMAIDEFLERHRADG